jgi:hypothetical protein
LQERCAVLSLSAFASDVPAGLLRDYTESIGWTVAHSTKFALDTLADGKKFQAAVLKAPPSIRDAVSRDLEACERIASGGLQAVLWPACGDDQSLRAEIEKLGSNRARALKLFLHHKPADDLSLVFRRAEALFDCGARRPGGKTWKLYRLTQFSRDWTPGRKLEASVKQVVEEQLSQLNEPKRLIKIELFSRPAHPDAGPDDLCHTIILNIASSSETEEDWHEGELAFRSKTPNRKIILCITPVSKGFDCGWHETNAAMANQVMRAVATRVLGQKDAPEPIEPVAINLTALAERRKTWVSAPEHQIGSVQVKKLVVSHGPGTRTYFAPARSKADAYDVAPRNLLGARIIAASLRVAFDKGAFGSGQKIVNFELAVPNRCSLRETDDAERVILEKYLGEWGLKDTDPDEDRPIRLAQAPGPFTVLLSVPTYAISTREAQNAFGTNVELLADLGALTPAPRDCFMICNDCGDHHSAVASSSGTGWVVHCPEAGSVKVAPEDLPAFTLSADALAVALSVSMPLKDLKVRRLSDDLFYLGSGAGKADWSALFAPTITSMRDLDSVSDCLRKNAALASGIVICSGEGPRQASLPGKHVFVSIDELFFLQGGRLHCNEQRLAHSLGRSKPPRSPGRPSAKTLAQRIANARRRLDVRSNSASEEIDAIKNMIVATQGPTDLPSDKVIRYEWLKDHLSRLSFPETPE